MVVSGLDGAGIERFGFAASGGPCVVLLVEGVGQGRGSLGVKVAGSLREAGEESAGRGSPFSRWRGNCEKYEKIRHIT